MLNSIIPFQIFSPIIGKCQKRPFSEMIDRFEIPIYLLKFPQEGSEKHFILFLKVALQRSVVAATAAGPRPTRARAPRISGFLSTGTWSRKGSSRRRVCTATCTGPSAAQRPTSRLGNCLLFYG
jgi:hypothetical protein